jgi:hypothetical protein
MTDLNAPLPDNDLQLVILKDRSFFTDAKGVQHEFKEGAVDRAAQDQMRQVRTALENGFLTDLIRTE